MPTYAYQQIHTVADLRHVANEAGSHFFDRGNMKFFNSRVLPGVTAVDGPDTVEGARFLFVTSEANEWDGRKYNVRLMTLTSVRDNRPGVDIDTVLEHMTYETPARARAALKAFAADL